MLTENHMPITSSSPPVFVLLGAVFAIAVTAPIHAQQPSARNVFWSASDLVQVLENPGAKAAADQVQPAPPKKAPTPRARQHVEPELIAKNGYGEQPQLVSVSDDQIGIRYALLLRDNGGRYDEVSPVTIFHNGDRLRLSIMANQPGYLYVIEQGSSGSWNSIYPGKQAADNAEPTNRIESGRVYQVPDGKGAFRFDQNAGQEKLFLVLSRQRIADLEGAINSLKQGGQPPAAPAHPDPPAAPGEMIEASNTIPDAFVQQLSSRDLTLVEEETVDQPQPGDQPGEKAVYVVSKVSSAKNESPRVVASVSLRHD
jgi:hypothetical protein